mmetsp:Transcript_36505/g.88876  ORF Transcript_36505/g.88876 Transcript_36505/m.88876 type:complete len:92 (-) Transcript_36505:414-689(-)
MYPVQPCSLPFTVSVCAPCRLAHTTGATFLYAQLSRDRCRSVQHVRAFFSPPRSIFPLPAQSCAHEYNSGGACVHAMYDDSGCGFPLHCVK